jgi:hypothetical protein
MKTLSLEQMQVIEGGNWLNNHTWWQHAICMGVGVLGVEGGPIGVTAAMSFCYMMFPNEND